MFWGTGLRKTLVIVAMLLTTMLGGCASGFKASNHSVKVDNSTVDPELKRSLANARKLAFLGSDDSRELSYLVEHLELEGGYEASIERVSSVKSPSQIRKLAQQVCQGADKPDLVFSASNSETNIGGGATVQALFTGRTSFNMNRNVNVLRCRDGWISKFSISVYIDQGMYNADQAKMSELLGREYAVALMEMADRGEHSTRASGEAAADSNLAAAVDSSLIGEIQDKLARTGHYQGVVDGLYGPKTRKAISDYQKSMGLIVTGEPTEDLLSHLKKN